MRIKLDMPQKAALPKKNQTPAKGKREIKKFDKPDKLAMSESDIREKIAARKAKKSAVATGGVKGAPDKGQLRELLKKSNFSFSAKERQVFAKILGKDS